MTPLHTTSRPLVFDPPRVHDPRPEAPAWRWSRDWAFIGLVTAGLAPMLATQMIPGIPLRFAGVAALLGGLSGGAVGALFPRLLAWAPARARPSVSLVVGVPLLGLWGAAVAGLASLLTCPNFAPLALACGSISAMVQCLWLAPLYTWLAVSGRPTLPVALVAPTVGSPFAGAFSAVTVLMLFQLSFAAGRLFI